MKRLLFFLIIFTVIFPAHAQSASAPLLTLEKTLFQEQEPVTLTYRGEPTKLQAEIVSGTGTPVAFQAVLANDTLTILPTLPWNPDNYRVRFTKDQQVILDRWITIGQPTVTINRTQSTFIQANRPHSVDLAVTGHVPQSSSSALIDFVPFEAILTDQNIEQHKLPDFIHPRFPFDAEYEMTLPFGNVDPDEHLGMPTHDGIDYAVPMGTAIKAVDDGEVVPYREENDYGITIAVQHAWGQTFYGHLSTISAQIGDRVTKGQVVGLSGNTGRSTGAHLHFGMKWNNERMIDPAPYLHRDNEYRSAEKKLILRLPTDEPRRTYSYLLPRTVAAPRVIQLSGAYLEDDRGMRITSETTPRIYITGPDSLASITQNDVHISPKTVFTHKDDVVIWKNESEQSIHAYDIRSEAYSIQSIVNTPLQDFAIGDHRYLLTIGENSLSLQ